MRDSGGGTGDIGYQIEMRDARSEMWDNATHAAISGPLECATRIPHHASCISHIPYLTSRIPYLPSVIK